MRILINHGEISENQLACGGAQPRGEGYIRTGVGVVVCCHVWEEWTPQICPTILLWRAFHPCLLSWALVSFASVHPPAMYTAKTIRVASLGMATTYISLSVCAAHANRLCLVTLITGVWFGSMAEGQDTHFYFFHTTGHTSRLTSGILGAFPLLRFDTRCSPDDVNVSRRERLTIVIG